MAHRRAQRGAARPPCHARTDEHVEHGDRAREDQREEPVGRAAGALPREAGALHREQRALRLAVHLRSRRASLLHDRRARPDDERAGPVQPARQDPPRQRRRIDPEGQSVREPSGRVSVDLELRAPQSAGARVGSGHRQAVGDRSTARRAATRSTSSRRGTTTAGASSRWASSRASRSAPRTAWSSRSCYYTPTIAPSGIVFYTGTRYPAWKNNLFVSCPRRASSCGAWRFAATR